MDFTVPALPTPSSSSSSPSPSPWPIARAARRSSVKPSRGATKRRRFSAQRGSSGSMAIPKPEQPTGQHGQQLMSAIIKKSPKKCFHDKTRQNTFWENIPSFSNYCLRHKHHRNDPIGFGPKHWPPTRLLQARWRKRRGEARRSPSASAPFIEHSKDLWEVSAGNEAKDYQGRESNQRTLRVNELLAKDFIVTDLIHFGKPCAAAWLGTQTVITVL